MNKKIKVKIETTIYVWIKKVWEFWTLPKHIAKWNFASDDWHCPKAENDLRIGGKMSSRMEAKDGSFGFDFEAIYSEIIKWKKIAYQMTDGRVAITHFKNLGGKTKVSTIFDAENENLIEMQKGGWQAILNNFKKYAESK